MTSRKKPEPRLVLKRELRMKELLDAISGYMMVRYGKSKRMQELLDKDGEYKVKVKFHLPAKDNDSTVAEVNIFDLSPDE